MKNIIAIIAVLTLSACTTPTYTMKSTKTGQIETCGGDTTASLAGGVIGYHIQKSNDEKCRRILEENGFKEVK